MQMTGWVGVRDRVEQLSLRTSSAKVFGADHHLFHLAAPLSAAELSQVEQQLGVTFPQEYRTFLTEVGAGGAGPEYGLFALTRAADGHWAWSCDESDDLTDLSTLGTSFDPGDLRDDQQRLWAAKPADYESADYRDWVRRWDDLLWTPGRTAGAVCINHEGCGHHTWLVVSGPQRGTIWTDARGSDHDLEPLRALTAGP